MLKYLNNSVECPNCNKEIRLSPWTHCYNTVKVGERRMICHHCNTPFKLVAAAQFSSEKV